MIILTGSSLNQRHQELNSKVNDAVKRNVNFEELSDKNEMSDIDNLFNIDLASKYENIDYVLNVLKSGDSLYISRALKCDWIIKDKFAQFMNPQYLERNIFPFVAPKMKKKILATISSRLRNGERAEEFHHYCMHNKMHKLGMNFLLYTNEAFKIEILALHPHVYNDFNQNEKYLEHFIGNSFLLAEHYLKIVSNVSQVLFKLRYLYSVSQDKYLDLLEKFLCNSEYSLHCTSQRLSRGIMKKHKNRVLKHPWLYLHTVDRATLLKYSTSDDAKVYAVSYLPDSCYSFWTNNYCVYTDFFLQLIPFCERFSFIKKIFTEKYPGEEFEENYNFYVYAYYEMMTVQEKENWALKHIASKKELHGCGNDYVWYRFVNFQLALVEIKKYILITADNDKRSDIVLILVESAKTEEELTTLLDYYYNRHTNELNEYKRKFMNKVIEKIIIFEIGDKFWASFDKILYSLDVYNKLSEDSHDYQNNEYRTLALIYYVLQKKPVPEVLRGFLISGTITISRETWRFSQYWDSTHFDIIYQYAISCLSNHVKSLISNEEQNLDELCRLINEMFGLICNFNKAFEDIPEIIRDFILKYEDMFEVYQYFFKTNNTDTDFIYPRQITPPPKFGISDIMHYLKESSSLVVTNFSMIKEYFENVDEKKKKNINWLIRKLKIYFHHDLALEFIKLLAECLSVKEIRLHMARVSVYGILNLSDEKYKVDFLKKYVPVNSKIDHVNIPGNLLTIQKAICSVASNSRPPLPLSNIREYITGDYLKFCIPMFDSFRANLMPAQFICFVESLLDSPVSIQKHGLRLAFHCFDTENLKNLVLKAWKKTKNVSLRKILFKTLIDKVNDHHDNIQVQWELFGALNIITYDLNYDDSEELLELLHYGLPPNVLGHHLRSAYIVVNSFPKTETNRQRLLKIVREMITNVELISKHILFAITEDHIISMLDEDNKLNASLEFGLHDLFSAKWSLIITVIIKHKNMDIINLIMNKVLIKWHETKNCSYVYRSFFTELLHQLEQLSFQEPIESYLEINNIFQTILIEMEKVLPHIEIYVILWGLKLNIIRRQVLGENVSNLNQNDTHIAKPVVNETMLKFSHKVKDLVQEYINNGKFFILFCQDIMEAVRGVIMKVTSALDSFVDNSINSSDIEVLLCSVLLQCEAREVQQFVASFLPVSYCGEYGTEYLDVIKKLISVDNNEIKYFMSHRFHCSFPPLPPPLPPPPPPIIN